MGHLDIVNHQKEYILGYFEITSKIDILNYNLHHTRHCQNLEDKICWTSDFINSQQKFFSAKHLCYYGTYIYGSYQQEVKCMECYYHLHITTILYSMTPLLLPF